MIRIYDNEGKTADRYTVVYMHLSERAPGTFEALGMNSEPFHGIGMHCSAMPGRHLGKRIEFAQLPEQCQRAVIQDVNATPAELDELVAGYLECAAWADKEEGTNPRFSADAKATAYVECAEFVLACGPLLAQASELRDYEHLGHDFWLSRCGHGAGFWDRDELDVQPCKAVMATDRNGKEYDPCERGRGNLGDVLTAIAYGTNNAISPFAYPTLTQYRGWLYF